MSRADDDALAQSWHDLMGRYQRMMCTLDRELEQHGLNASEFEVLQQLHSGKACELPMSALAEHAHLTQSALSRLVSRLEKDGLITRKTCSNDRRAQFVALTDEGRRRYREAKPTQRQVLREGAVDCPQLVPSPRS
jgi:DNA-binding MarR family transcriptional regulator